MQIPPDRKHDWMGIPMKASNSKQKAQIILGIDPGSVIMGYSIVHSRLGKAKALDSGVIKLQSSSSHYQRLSVIFHEIQTLITQHSPDVLAIEAPFHGKNVQSMLKLGRAQGAAITAAMLRGIPVIEYSPRKIKQAITGNGNASKEQVAYMLKTQLLIKQLPKNLDETDALATALCHHYQSNQIGAGQKVYKNWADYVKAQEG